MKTQRVVNRCLLGLVVLAGGVRLSYGEEDTGQMSFGASNNGVETYGGVLMGEERDTFLKDLNDARAAVGVEPLVWSDDIARYSLRWLAQNGNDYRNASDAGNQVSVAHRPRQGDFKHIEIAK